jgi:phosphoserine aminotransferase
MTNYNFGAGPACLPIEVMQRIKEDLPHWHDGMSIMELSHRSEIVLAHTAKIEENLRSLLKIPDNFAVLFMQGGARTQFSAILLNLLNGAPTADYLITGHWSQLAFNDAKVYCHAHCAATGEANQFTRIPEESTWSFTETSPFLHYTENETVHGVEFHKLPTTQKWLISDMTSSIAARPIDFSRMGCIYASAQKNLGIAGITVVIVRKDLLGNAHPMTPPTLNYTLCHEMGSMINTPPVFPWYVLGLVVEWALSQGGCENLAKIQAQKAKLIYDVIDESDLYSNPVYPADRSLINIPFSVKNEALEKRFLAEANEAGLKQLKGHKVVGGCRASLYNAMPVEGAACLADFMKDFEKRA